MEQIKITDELFYIGESLQFKDAYIEYDIKEDVLIIRHTEVNKRLRGQGIGVTLIEAVVEHAREKGYLVHSTCGYASAILKKRSDLNDVLSIRDTSV